MDWGKAFAPLSKKKRTKTSTPKEKLVIVSKIQ
jgi:hypothetical protein